MNTTVPTSTTEIFNTSKDAQTTVKIMVLQGESELAHENELVRSEEQAAQDKCSLTLHDNGDGTTTGQYQVDNQDVSGSRENGTVTCLAVDGDQAWIGGVITHSSIPGREGTPRLFRVIERGHGAPPDQASVLIVTAEARVECQTRPLLPVQDLEEGKILVRDDVPEPVPA